MLRFLIALSCSITLLAAFFGYQPPRAPPGPATTLHVAFGAGGTTPPPSLPGTDATIPLIGADDFARSAQDAWPAALKGGDYTLLGPSVDFAAGAGVGTIRTPSGQGRAATLLGISARDVDLRIRVESDRDVEGGDQFVFLTIRRVDDATNYLARVRFDDTHTAWLQVARTVRAATELLGTETRVPDFTHGPGSALWVRAAASGEAPTTLRLKAWPDAQVEPESWQYATTDDETSLASTGAVAIQTYVSARTTNAPVTFRFSDFRVSAAGPELLAMAPIPLLTPTPQARVVEAAPEPPVAPTPVPTLTVVEVWRALVPALDAAWGIDTPRTIALLDEFLSRYPNHGAAREKLYAALLSAGRELMSQNNADDSAQAVEILGRAQSLFPERAEAQDALARLTPTPTPAPAPQAEPVVVRPAQIIVRPPPPPVRAPVVPAAVRPTPTKVPFVAPPSEP